MLLLFSESLQNTSKALYLTCLIPLLFFSSAKTTSEGLCRIISWPEAVSFIFLLLKQQVILWVNVCFKIGFGQSKITRFPVSVSLQAYAS